MLKFKRGKQPDDGWPLWASEWLYNNNFKKKLKKKTSDFSWDTGSDV